MLRGTVEDAQEVSTADATTATKHRTPGYEHWPEQRRRRLVTEEYEYEFSFHYANVTVNRL